MNITQLVHTIHNIYRGRVETPNTTLIHLKKSGFLVTSLLDKKNNT